MSAEPGSGTPAVRWTGRAYVLLGAGAALAAVSVAERLAVPLFVALPLLLAPFASAALGAGRDGGVDLAWKAEGIGESVTIVGRLEGPWGRELDDLVVEPVPVPGSVVASALRVRRDRDGLGFTVGWTLATPTISAVPPPRILWRDPLGLAERELGGARPPLVLSRYPAELHRLDALRLDRTTLLPGETRSRRIGTGGEFFGLREALPNEPRERINWRASARVGHLLANDYEIDLTGDLLLLLDVRPSALDPVLDARLNGIARAGVYGIAEALFRGKVRVAYATFGEFLTALPLSAGRGHRARVLEAVQASRLALVSGPAERCAFSLKRFYRPGLTTLVVSSWAGEPSEELVPYLHRQGFPPVLVAPSPLPMLQGVGELPPEEERLARRLEFLDRQVRLAETWRFAPVIDWSDYWSLEGLARFLRRPAFRRVA